MHNRVFCMPNLVPDPWGCFFWIAWNVWAIIVTWAFLASWLHVHLGKCRQERVAQAGREGGCRKGWVVVVVGRRQWCVGCRSWVWLTCPCWLDCSKVGISSRCGEGPPGRRSSGAWGVGPACGWPVPAALSARGSFPRRLARLFLFLLTWMFLWRLCSKRLFWIVFKSWGVERRLRSVVYMVYFASARLLILGASTGLTLSYTTILQHCTEGLL